MISPKQIFLSFTARERKVFLAAAFFLVISGAVLTALAWQNATEAVPARGGEYTEGMTGQPTYVNPVLASSEADKALTRLLFANLPVLADKIEPDQNGRVWRVRLKEGLVWSDGRQLTSDDVIFTVQKIQDPETQSPLFGAWQGVAANRMSELELQFNLVGPYSFFGENLETLYVLPKHLYAETPSPNWRLSEYNLKPIGSGPFAFDFSEKQPNGFITSYHLKENPNYAGGAALLQKFTVRFFSKPEDLLKAFNGGTVDGFATLDPEMVGKVDRSYQSISFGLPGYYAVFLNQSQNLALKETAVRRALSESVDRKKLIDGIFRGKAVAVTGPVPPAFLPATEPVAPDLDAVRANLEAAGWKMGENNVREKTVGRSDKIRLEFTLTVPELPFLEQTAEELQSAWREAGIQANLERVPADGIVNGAIKNREYQAVLFGNVMNPPGDLYSFWHSNERFHPGLNLSLYSGREADRLIENVRRELDAEKRLADLRELQEAISSDFPAVFLYSPDYQMLANKELRGVSSGLIADLADRFRKAGEWHLRTARALK